jgi:hypothetical protein
MSRTCVKVGNLRSVYNDDSITFEKWLENPDNIYVGRNGRIFINKQIFHYKDSIWKNPYTIKKHGREKCLKLYKEYILDKIKSDPLIYDITKLKDKNLGCWCKPRETCHSDFILQLLLLYNL